MNLLKKLFPIIALTLAACGAPADGQSSKVGIDVVTTFYPVYNFTSQVLGENGQVSMLLGAGQDTHNYEPTPKDMAAIAEADVFIYSSEYMETWVPAVLDTLAGSNVKVIEAAADIPFYEGEDLEEHAEEEHAEEEHTDEEHYEGDGHNHAIDPHVWLDPVYAKQMVETIATGIQEVDAENAEQYQEQTALFVGKLEDLDASFQAAFSDADNRAFVVQHAAFGYLARRYNLEEIAISSLTSNQEVSPAKLAEIGKYIKDNQVEVIFYQDSANNDLAETLANETGVGLDNLSAVEGVTDEDQAAGVDYLTIMHDNLEALKRAIK